MEWSKAISIGKSKQEDGQYQEAIRYFNKALVIVRNNGSKEKEVKTLVMLAELYNSIEKYHEAVDYYEKGLAIVQETGDKKLEGMMCRVLGISKLKQGQHEEAIECFNKALIIAQSNGSKEEEARTLRLLADLYWSIEKYEEAVDYYEKGLTTVQETGNEKLEGMMCKCLGISKQKQGQHEEAIECFNKALIIAQSNGSKEEEAQTLGLLADLYKSIEKYHEAVDYYEKGLSIVQETGDEKLEWKMYTGLVDAYNKLGQYNNCMKYSKQGLVIALRAGDSELIANSYNNLGSTYEKLFDYKNNIKCLYKAIDMYKQLGDEEGLAFCYGNLSSSYLSQGKFHDAIYFQEESLRINHKVGNKEAKANSLIHLGNIHSTLNNSKRAVDFYQQSLIIVTEISHKGLQGSCYANLGNVLMKSGHYTDAIDYYLKSLTIAEQLDLKATLATVNLNIGICFRNMNQYQEANKYYIKSLMIAKEIKKKSTEASLYYHIAELHFVISEFQQAIEMLEKSLVVALSIIDKTTEWHAYFLLGKAYHSLAKDKQEHKTHVSYMTKSEENLKNALKCCNYLFSQLQHRDQFKISIFDSFTITYKLLTTVLIETQQIKEALLVSDHGRGRALGDQLIFNYGMSQEKEKSMSSKQLMYPDVERVLSNDSFTLLHYSLLNNSVAVWVLSKHSFTFKEIDKEHFVSALKTLSGEVKKEQEEDTFHCLFADTVARAYKDMKIQEEVTCENRSLDFCRTPKDQQGDGVSESVSRGGTSVEEPWQNSHSLEVLYNILVAPVLSHIQHDDIVIVPDGEMYTIPFAALKDPNTGQYLSETKHIRIVPSITILKVLQEYPVDHHCQQGALIVGNPSVGEVMFRRKKTTALAWDLPHAEDEVLEITNLLNDESEGRIANPIITTLTGKQATKNVVLKMLKEQVAIIHIAAHGSSEFGEIVLAPIASSVSSGEVPEERDYLLTMKEVQQVGIKAQLVVLSCCHSGRGKIRAEGVVGLSRSFLAAGACAVVASLWGIKDKATRKFMVSFYSRLKKGRSASASLHGAMKDMRSRKRHSDPKKWAPFFLIGDDVTIKFGR